MRRSKRLFKLSNAVTLNVKASTHKNLLNESYLLSDYAAGFAVVSHRVGDGDGSRPLHAGKMLLSPYRFLQIIKQCWSRIYNY